MHVDSHAHLDDPDFDADRAAVMARARAAGVRYLLAVGGGTGPDNLEATAALAESHDWIYATVGVHPHDATHFTERHAEQISKLAQRPRVVGIGEIGLDYHYDNSPRDVQSPCSFGRWNWLVKQGAQLLFTAARRGRTSAKSLKLTGNRAGWAASCIAFRAHVWTR